MPNLLFRNHDGKYFVEISSSSGTGHLQKGHGVSFADLDNDGDEDLFENLGGAVPGDKYNSVLFANPGHTNNWISIKLLGVKSNRVGIGAKIKLTLKGGPGGAIRYREVSSGGSFGASPLMQHIGIGKATRIASIEITWPASGTRQEFKNVAPNQFIEIKELEKTYTKRRIQPITWKHSRGQSTHRTSESVVMPKPLTLINHPVKGGLPRSRLAAKLGVTLNDLSTNAFGKLFT